MTAHHFFVEPADIEERTVRIEGSEAHHAVRVLRVRVGEEITVADGSGRVISAVVSHVDDFVEADIRTDVRSSPAKPAITLAQALAKGDKFESVVEKAVEVGVTTIVPFVATRSVVRWDDRKRARTRERWTAIATAAAKQSKSAWLLRVTAVQDTLRAAIDGHRVSLVLHEGADVRLRDVLPEQPPETLALAVGPEGGFTDEEINELDGAGAQIVSLGPRILRTETAGVVAAAVIGYAYGTVG